MTEKDKERLKAEVESLRDNTILPDLKKWDALLFYVNNLQTVNITGDESQANLELQRDIDRMKGVIDNLQREKFRIESILKDVDEIGESNTILAKSCLQSVKAMLQHSNCGTHRERNFYSDATVKYIDRCIEDLRKPKANDDVPF